ncbi:uncharacterized protein LOC116776999 [Danaus plexippus]|uniref:StAR-related lipid transfer protein 7 n=1 Tax=Danaus plexippus plexippus TaxID=278856 RepID=A0A212EHN2_DANPL|nr:uncharacterized protein LOC116776999 [Danaus plexippus plexippus]XP_061385148.1 uncharacterized protein LOC116776999 [Danaus plexippus]OWR40996.1 stAR-related lipid transfer protein 7 [Danaus plexippus plexippus]
MSAVRFKFILKNLNVRIFSAWTRRFLVNDVVKRCIRDWGAKEVIQCFKQTILRPRRTLLISATAAYKSRDDSYSCDKGISDDEMQALLSELNNAETLTKLTMYCTSCGKRLVVDRKQNGVSYCGCKEPQTSSDPDGWVPYMEAEDVIIWRKEYKPGQALYAYKVYGRYPEVLASDFAAVQVDGAYRRSWDSAVASLSVVQRDVDNVAGQAVLHWEVLWPRLFANRDYVYIRRHKEFEITSDKPKTEKKTSFEHSVHARAKKRSMEGDTREEERGNKLYIIISKSCEHPEVPETKNAIRVSEYWSHMVVKSIDGSDKPGMEFVLTYYDEPGVGGMPCGVAAWASSRAAPIYLQTMRRAASEYRAWAALRDPQDLPDFIPFGPEVVNQEETEMLEEDMESSKRGPELNGLTQDKESQTDEYLLESISNKTHIQPDTQNAYRKDDAEEKKDAEDTAEEGMSPEEEPNGSWWRYLYPFYYFV